MSISADEVNYLIYRYLQENGFSHSAFTFGHESFVAKSSVAYTDVPPGALITFLQKGLEYVGIEEHIGDDGTIREFENHNHSLLSPFICDAVAVKEDRRSRKITSTQPGAGMEVDAEAASEEGQNENSYPPCHAIVKGDANKKWLHLAGHQGEVYICAWNPVSKQLASGSRDGVCRLWNFHGVDKEKWTAVDSQLSLRSAVLSHTVYPGQRFKDVTSISWSPDGQSFATGCYDGSVRIWDSQGALKAMMQEHSGPIFCLSWSKSGKYLLSGSHDRRTNVYNPIDGSVVKAFLHHSAPVFDTDWLDDDIFATSSADMSIVICTVSSADGKPLHTFTGHESEINTVRFSPNGQLLASCSDDNTAKIWSFRNGLIHTLSGHTKEIYTMRWAAQESNQLLCTASFDGTVKVWDASLGKELHTISRHNQAVYSIAPSPNGQLLAIGCLGGYVSVWKLSDGSFSSEYRGTGDTFDVAWSHDGSLLSSCYSSGSIRLTDGSA